MIALRRLLPSADRKNTRSVLPTVVTALRRGSLVLAALPLLLAASLGAASPEDAVIFDFDNTAIYTINSQGATAGALTKVAASDVGSGTSFTTKVSFGTVSPTQQLYYWDSTALSFFRIDLTSAVYPRAKVIAPTNSALIPVLPQRGFPGIAWDFANNAFVYYDSGTGGSTASNGSTLVKGIYRFTPSTTTGVPSTSVLLLNFAAAGYGTTTGCNGIAVKQDGTVYALLDITNQSAPQIVRIDTPTSAPRVDGTAGTYTGFQTLTGISWDFVNQRILIFDQAQSQAAAKIVSLDPTTGTRTLVSSGNTASGAYGGGYINAPTSGFRNTANRVIYYDIDVATFTKLELSTVPPGSTIASQYYTAGTFSFNAQFLSFVPPSLPVITSPTATPGAGGTSATLGANVTSSGTAIVSPAVQTRGVVYSLTSANSNPTIGGTGVTNVTASAATGTYTVSASGLNAGATYSYAGYVSTYYGLVYTSVGTFTTSTLATVTTPTATAITGTSATLGGNVTSDGGGTITTRGVVYSTTANNTNPIIGQSGVVNVTTTGTTGVFTVGASSLANGTQYSYRAYATNSVGTSYTVATTFTTLSKPTANPQSVNVPFNTATAITLTGTDPNTPAQTLTYAITASPTHGTLSGTAPNVTYTPTAGYNGADSFQFTTTTAAGGTSSAATVSLTVAAGTPTANPQSVGVPFNTATAVTLTGTDPDSPALTLTYTVVATPGHGTLSGTAPSLTYTPTANYQGADSFTFRVSNGTNNSNTATVSITVAAGTPTANAQTVTTSFNTAKAITLTGTDPDSPALSLTYTVATSPAHGSLSGTAPNLTYTPTANYQGADGFTFTVSNGQKTSTAATVSITVSAGTPTANAQTVTTSFNTAKAITLTGTDPDSPALSLTYTVATSPTHGTLSGTAPNLTYTPAANYQGADSFTFTVSNGQKTSSTATVSITVAAGTPTANAQTVTTSFNTAMAITLTGTDPDSPALSLTYTVATSPAHGTLSGTAPNLTYTPAGNYQGADSFTFAVSNGANTSVPATVSITVAAGTPTANSQNVVVNLNTATAITLTGTDPDSPALGLTYTVLTPPVNGVLTGTAPNLTYTPATGYSGADSFTFRVSNGTNTSNTATVSITVVGQPYMTGFTPASGAVGSTVVITGNNFLGTTGVSFFRNVAAPTFTVLSNTQINVVVPAGARTGVITVTNGLGSNTTSTKFTVTP